MPRRVAVSTLNASTIDILNVIRQNASLEYQNAVPVITSENDIPKVGDIIYGTPAFANYFVNSLINRIALVRVKSANFNNMYADLKKGYLEFGETVEEVFVNIAKAREFSVEKAESREFKRTLPDVRTAFHAMNYRVQYPITIQDEDLRQAFLSMDGVQDLIARIVDAVYTANEYDEYLLFKYLIIKAVTKGQMYPIGVDVSDIKNAGIKFRGTSNTLEFMNTKYNASGVHTITKKEDQQIFLDASFDAQYDVGVLASAFNMDKADFMGRRRLIDDWTTFDNERFEVIRAGSDQIEAVTDAELAMMADVVGVLVDTEWFQVYDNLTRFTETYVGSGLYWNYFLNVWKTVSSSPFSNAIVFVKSTAVPTTPASYTGKVAGIDTNGDTTVYTISIDDVADLGGGNVRFIQTQSAAQAGIGITPYGAVFIGAHVDTSTTTSVGLVIEDGAGNQYGATLTFATADVGDTLTFSSDF